MEIKDLLIEIDNLKEEIKTYPKQTAGEVERGLEEFMVEYTYNSNAIDGSTLTLSETALVLLEGLTIDQKPLRDHLDARGHQDALII